MTRTIRPPWPWPCARVVPPGLASWRFVAGGCDCRHHCDDAPHWRDCPAPPFPHLKGRAA